MYYAAPEAERRTAESLAGIPGMERVKLHRLAPEGGLLQQVVGPRLRGWLRKGLTPVDWLHLHGIWNPILPHVAAVARRRGKPYALVPHGMLDPWSLRGQGRAKALKKELALAVVYRRMIQGATFLHVLNADEVRLLQPLGLRPPCVVLPNGIFAEEVTPQPPAGAFRAAHPELGDDPFVLFLSRLHFKKGLDYLIAALERVVERQRRGRLVIAGPDDGMAGPLVEQAQRLGLRERVHLVGPLYGPDKLGALVDCAVFCLPSRQEGFSMAIIEALACSKPVVISDACHFPEVAEVGAGFVVPVGAEPTAAALDRALSLDQQQVAAMGEAGRQLVMERFTWPRIAARTIEAYRQHG